MFATFFNLFRNFISCMNQGLARTTVCIHWSK